MNAARTTTMTLVVHSDRPGTRGPRRNSPIGGLCTHEVTMSFGSVPTSEDLTQSNTRQPKITHSCAGPVVPGSRGPGDQRRPWVEEDWRHPKSRPLMTQPGGGCSARVPGAGPSQAQ